VKFDFNQVDRSYMVFRNVGSARSHQYSIDVLEPITPLAPMIIPSSDKDGSHRPDDCRDDHCPSVDVHPASPKASS
jgi:hypothetical protein